MRYFLVFQILLLMASHEGACELPPTSEFSDEDALKGELLIAKSEAKALDQLNTLLENHKGSGLEPTLWMHKAELYIRKSKTSRFFELYRENTGSIKSSSRSTQRSEVRRDIQEAIKVYDILQSRFPKFRDADLVLFHNAYAHQIIDDVRKSERLYRMLLEKHPDSSLVPDSHLAIGEMSFDNKKFSHALEEFEKIKKYPMSRVYIYSLYKSAWTRYNLHDTNGAIRDLERVVELSRKISTSHSKLDLRKESLVDLVLFFSEARDPKSAYAYFDKISDDAAHGPLLLRLAKIYETHGKHAELNQILTDYIKFLPDTRERILAERDLVNNYDTLKNRSMAMKHLQTLATSCHRSSSWVKSNMNSQDVGSGGVEKLEEECRGVVRDATLKLSAKWHKIWLADKREEMGRATRLAYEVYLASKPEMSATNVVRHAYGEFLYQSGDYRSASEQYEIVASGSESEQLRHDSSHAALVSLEKAAGDRWSDVDEIRFSKLATSYLKNKTTPFAHEVRFKRALIGYEKNKFSDVSEEFRELGQTSSGHVQEKSQDLYLDILNHQKRYTEISAYVEMCLKQKLSETRRLLLTKILHESSFAAIQKTEEGGENSKAIDEYQKYVKDFPNSPMVDKAFWNRIQLLYKVERWVEASDDGIEFARRYPKSKLSLESLIKAAQTLENLGQLKRASAVVLELVKIDDSHKMKWSAIAADYLFLSGSREQALKIYRDLTIASDSKISDLAILRLESIGNTPRDASLDRSYVQVLNDMTQAMPKAQKSFALARLAEVAYKLGKFEHAFKMATSVGDDSRISASTRARARMVQALILDREFRQQSVKTQPEKLGIVLSVKTQKLEKAQDAFQGVIRCGSPGHSVQALNHLAKIYGEYVSALRTIQFVGRTLSRSEIDSFRVELEKLATPIEERRLDTLLQALQQAKKLNIRDGTVGELQTEIDRLNMAEHRSVSREVVVPDVQVPRVLGSVL